MSRKKRIVATSWHPGGVNAIVPVIKLLLEEKKIDIVVIGHQFSEEIFQRANIDYRTIGFYGLKNVCLNSMEQLLQRESPDLILTGTSAQDDNNRDVIEQTITLAGRKAGIKTLAVLDFWGNYSQRFSDTYAVEKFKFLPDKIAIIDRLAEKAMLKEEFPRETLVITGNPYFDSLTKLKEEFGEEDKQRVRTDLGIDSNAYLLLYASQPIEYHYGEQLGYTEKTALRELLRAVGLLSNKTNVGVLVKVHPREDKKGLERVAGEYDLPIVVDQLYPTRLAILASDVVISPFSTVLIESSYLDKPSISLQPGLKKDDLLITNKLGITIPVYKQGEVSVILERFLFDEDYSKEVSQKRKDFRTDGKAAERVAKLVYRMVKIE